MRCQALVLCVGSLLAATALLGACGSTQVTELPSDPVAREKAIGEMLTLRDPRTGEEKGASYLEVTIANPTRGRISVRCAPEWYDAKGAVVTGATDWQQLELKAAEERRLRFAPMPAAARSWRMRFDS